MEFHPFSQGKGIFQTILGCGIARGKHKLKKFALPRRIDLDQGLINVCHVSQFSGIGHTGVKGCNAIG